MQSRAVAVARSLANADGVGGASFGGRAFLQWAVLFLPHRVYERCSLAFGEDAECALILRRMKCSVRVDVNVTASLVAPHL